LGGTLRTGGSQTQDLHFNSILIHKLQSLFMHIHQIRPQRLALPRRRINRRLVRHYPRQPPFPNSNTSKTGRGTTFRKLPCFLNGDFSVFQWHLARFSGGIGGEGGWFGEFYGSAGWGNWCGVRQLRHGGENYFGPGVQGGGPFEAYNRSRISVRTQTQFCHNVSCIAS
jgi:hypothetical protein